MTHTDICKQVVIDFAKDKIEIHIIDNGTGYRRNGVPFHYGCEDGFSDCFGNDETGKCYFIEVKTLKYKTLSKEQKAFLTRKGMRGCICYVAMENPDGKGYYLIPWK